MASSPITPTPLTSRDFQLHNEWSQDTRILVDSAPNSTSQKVLELVHCSDQLKKGASLLVQDKSTGYFYFNVPKRTLRKKHIILLGIAPLTIPFFICSVAIKNIFRTVTFYHLQTKDLTPIDRCKRTTIDIARIIALPLIAAGLALSSLYALFSPYDGEKMFTTMERLSDNAIKTYPITEETIRAVTSG